MNQQTLDIEFQNYARENAAHQYYRAISGQLRSLKATLGGASPIGPLDIYLLTGNGPRRTAYVNQNGMLVSDSRDQRVNPLAPIGRSLWPDYTAVVIPATKDGATYLAKMENPSHNALSPEQLPEQQDQKRASTALQAARTAIRSYIDDIVSAQHGTNLTNVTELSHRFPELEYLFDQELTDAGDAGFRSGRDSGRAARGADHRARTNQRTPSVRPKGQSAADHTDGCV